MNNQSNIFLVNSHSKGRSCHDYLRLSTHKSILVLHLLGCFHLAIEWQCPYTVAYQMLC